jgi:hypothetical protein
MKEHEKRAVKRLIRFFGFDINQIKSEHLSNMDVDFLYKNDRYEIYNIDSEQDMYDLNLYQKFTQPSPVKYKIKELIRFREIQLIQAKVVDNLEKENNIKNSILKKKEKLLNHFNRNPESKLFLVLNDDNNFFYSIWKYNKDEFKKLFSDLTDKVSFLYGIYFVTNDAGVYYDVKKDHLIINIT